MCSHMKCIAMLVVSCAFLAAQPGIGRDYGWSMTISQQGIAATSQILASQAGAQILARGGSAADAAIAANAVLGLVEPMMNGMGGDCFVLYWDAHSGKLTGLNASGPAPRALSPALLASLGLKTIPSAGNPQRHRARCCGRVGERCTSVSANCLGKTCSSPPSHMPSKVFPLRK
jgi:gamma-glutamyltranspeptidase/glutathione hydrolase